MLPALIHPAYSSSPATVTVQTIQTSTLVIFHSQSPVAHGGQPPLLRGAMCQRHTFSEPENHASDHITLHSGPARQPPHFIPPQEETNRNSSSSARVWFVKIKHSNKLLVQVAEKRYNSSCARSTRRHKSSSTVGGQG
jgi:hypothetical protein